MGVISGGVAASGNTCPGVRCPGVQEPCSPRYMNSQEEAELQSHLINSVGAQVAGSPIRILLLSSMIFYLTKARA
jgi:hypothetical protein